MQGKGRSYGAEVFAQKKTGDLTGWIGYTLSWTDRQFNELNDGKRFFYKYDRRHDISVALIKRFSSKLEVSATWVFGTGTRMTVPVSIYRMANPMEFSAETGGHGYWVGEEVYIEYDARNSYKMDAYHRLDLSASLIKKKRWGERRWIFSLYNAYWRRNPFYIDIKSETGYTREGWYAQKYEFVQYSLFPIVPSVSYQFRF